MGHSGHVWRICPSQKHGCLALSGDELRTTFSEVEGMEDAL